MKKILMTVVVGVLLMTIWGAFVFIGTVYGWFHTAITEERTTESFIESVESEIRKKFTGSFALAIMKDGVVAHEAFYAVDKRVDRNTVFPVSSLSKWISAFGIMKLVEGGQVHLDSPVSKYLTRWHLPPSTFDNNGVTVRRLLSHTAGLTDGLGYSGFAPGARVQTLEESLNKAADADPGVDGEVRVGLEPGSAFKYSGGGYTLLQLLVEEVSGQSFDVYMKRSVFEPLGMTHSTYRWNDESGHSLAQAYHADGTKAKHYRYTSLAATSLYTSLADLELFFNTHFAGPKGEPVGRVVLSPQTVRMMRQPHATEMGVEIWGLGTVLYAATNDGDFIIGHDGKSTPPINTAIRLNPETGDGIIVLETGNPNLATRLASEWVFWKTGKVDTLLFVMLQDSMVNQMLTGWIVILVGLIAFGILRKRVARVRVGG